MHQRHLRHGRVQGIEQQVAGLGHHHRGQHQAQLLSCPQPVAAKGATGLAMGDGVLGDARFSCRPQAGLSDQARIRG